MLSQTVKDFENRPKNIGKNYWTYATLFDLQRLNVRIWAQSL